MYGNSAFDLNQKLNCDMFSHSCVFPFLINHKEKDYFVNHIIRLPMPYSAKKSRLLGVFFHVFPKQNCAIACKNLFQIIRFLVQVYRGYN